MASTSIVKKSDITSLLDKFGTPFSNKEYFPFAYSLPKCYPKPMNEFKKENFEAFKETTLFYIFYNFMEKNSQKAAAIELCNKGWLYDSNTLTWMYKVEFSNKIGMSNVTIFKINSWKSEKASVDIAGCNFLGLNEFQEA